MAPQKKEPRERSKHFLKEWRVYLDIAQESAARAARISRANLSKIEQGLVPYNQDVLELLAMVYKCEPKDLISYDPANLPDLPIFSLPKGDQDRVAAFIKALQISNADPAANQPTDVNAPSPDGTPAVRKRTRRRHPKPAAP